MTIVEYIDITTRLINTNTGVFGQNNDFNVNVPQIVLNEFDEYTVNVEKFTYQNTNIGSNVYPIILCDIIFPIIVNDTRSSIIYKGNIEALNANQVYNDSTNNSTIYCKLNKKNFNNLQIQIVRSDNGQPFTINPLSSLSILLCIKKIT